MENKHRIDTELTPDGDYRWSGGRTSANISLNTTMSILQKREFNVFKKEICEKANYFYNPQFIYKLNIGSINNSRW